ncbi:ribonucleotide reductase [Parasulfitobacter algicola]|uniref:ribonucleoside-diphosphate reductase n=1 Tax=Parasulfitobacter algicola TaxID=2614809 RepID=A0ABX2IV70_9RHOB|nr:ribonucleotide reductase [Sulfitobacter algicola]NSX56808.1 ribonucleotide reductase [Sulfitobacter algicola]
MTYHDQPKPRHNLPARRLAENSRITTPDGHTIHLSIGYDPDDPQRPREVFYSAGFKSGSQLEFQLQDACVMISLLLQHGHRPEDIAKSLARTEQPDGSMAYASIIGLIAAELVEGTE